MPEATSRRRQESRGDKNKNVMSAIFETLKKGRSALGVPAAGGKPDLLSMLSSKGRGASRRCAARGCGRRAARGCGRCAARACGGAPPAGWLAARGCARPCDRRAADAVGDGGPPGAGDRAHEFLAEDRTVVVLALSLGSLRRISQRAARSRHVRWVIRVAYASERRASPWRQAPSSSGRWMVRNPRDSASSRPAPVSASSATAPP